MDGEKDHTPTEGTEEREKPSTIAEGVGNLVESVTHLVKETASVVVDHIRSPAAVSNRVETAVPKVEENYDAPPMTADELAAHAAADHQPSKTTPRATPMGIEVIGTPDAPQPLVEKKPRSKRRARPKSTSSRLTNLLGNPATPRKAEKAKSRKIAKKAAKKSKKKTAPKKAVKKAKPNKKAVRTAKASTSKKAPKKKRASKK
jgi:hypothetical protein